MTAQPLVLAWRAKTSDRVGALLAAALSLTMLVLFLVEDGGFFQAMATFVQANLLNLLPLGTGSLLLADLALLPTSNLRLHLIHFGGRLQTTASVEGIRYEAPLRRPRFVAWSDARLLEVREVGGRHFTLYGTSVVVQWHDRSGLSSMRGSLVPVGATTEQQAERAVDLLQLVRSRTGLTPRTFDSSLLPPPEISTGQARPAAAARRSRLTYHIVRWFWRLVFAAIVAGVVAGLLAFAAAVVLVPLTTSLVLDLLIAVAIGFPTILGTVLLVVKLREPSGVPLTPVNEPARLTPISTPPAQIQADPDIVYAYTITKGRRTLRSRLTAAGLGLLCTVLLIPAALGIFQALGVPLSGGFCLAGTGDFSLTAACLLAIPGIMGPLLLVASVFPQPPSRVRTIRAGPDALEADGLRIPWDRIEGLDVMRIGGRTTYMVHSMSTSSPLFWLEDRDPVVSTSVPGAEPVTAAQIADIVAQRSGVPLTVRDTGTG